MKTILVVEDNKEIRDEIRDIFKMENYNVLEAENGLDGFDIAINEIPDIIISDIMMPILDGYRMYEELKKNILTDRIPIIFLSALATNTDIRKGMNLGADDYLIKPVIPDDLIFATKNKLDKYDKMENKMENLKTELTKILHHELRTPLNGIIGFSDYLRDRVFELSKEDLKEIIDNIYESGMRLHKLVENYLYYADLKMIIADSEDIKNLRRGSFIETYDIINKVIKDKIPSERESDLNLDINSVNLKIEKEYLIKIVEELIDNAVKFSNQGNKITITSEADNQKYCLTVKNEGKGMRPEQIKMIGDFKQFRKKEMAQNGSGIGLTIVKLITDIYGGEISIKSLPERFITISITFKKGFKLF